MQESSGFCPWNREKENKSYRRSRPTVTLNGLFLLFKHALHELIIFVD